jgi:hypothetical protein
MIRHTLATAGFALLIAACSARSENADSSSVLTIDTVKPATATATDSAPADTVAATKAAPDTKTKSATKTKQGETKELGRDSIIRFDTKDKRRQLPPADTTRKP